MGNLETIKPKSLTKKKSKPIPINYSNYPNLMALSGIWKEKDIKLDELSNNDRGKK